MKTQLSNVVATAIALAFVTEQLTSHDVSPHVDETSCVPIQSASNYLLGAYQASGLAPSSGDIFSSVNLTRY